MGKQGMFWGIVLNGWLKDDIPESCGEGIDFTEYMRIYVNRFIPVGLLLKQNEANMLHIL